MFVGFRKRGSSVHFLRSGAYFSPIGHLKRPTHICTQMDVSLDWNEQRDGKQSRIS